MRRVQFDDGTSLDVISIDHLPTVIPKESSMEFSSALLPYLHELVDPTASSILSKAGRVFEQKLAEALV